MNAPRARRRDCCISPGARREGRAPPYSSVRSRQAEPGQMLIRASSRIAVGVTMIVAAGCGKDRTSSPTEVITVPVFEEVASDAAIAGNDDVHQLHVSPRGENEVPARDTRAKGEATF